MIRIIALLFAMAACPASAFCGDRHVAFERNDAIYIANLDGTGEKKIADGIFPAISPDGTRVAFNTVENERHKLCASDGGCRCFHRKS